VLRDALHRVLDKLQFGQVLLATVGSTAPFVGLLGTVWGIYHALTSIAGGRADHHRQGVWPGGRSADHDGRRAGGGHPRCVGLQRLWARIGRIEADLEGFARDLRELLASKA
jgi:biopolymer transport protein ExbB